MEHCFDHLDNHPTGKTATDADLLSVMRDLSSERLADLLTGYIVSEKYELCDMIKVIMEERDCN